MGVILVMPVRTFPPKSLGGCLHRRLPATPFCPPPVIDGLLLLFRGKCLAEHPRCRCGAGLIPARMLSIPSFCVRGISKAMEDSSGFPSVLFSHPQRKNVVLARAPCPTLLLWPAIMSERYNPGTLHGPHAGRPAVDQTKPSPVPPSFRFPCPGAQCANTARARPSPFRPTGGQGPGSDDELRSAAHHPPFTKGTCSIQNVLKLIW